MPHNAMLHSSEERGKSRQTQASLLIQGDIQSGYLPVGPDLDVLGTYTMLSFRSSIATETNYCNAKDNMKNKKF
jgi:hypothetical protein